MFDANTAERNNLINRLTTADRLNADVQQLVDVMLEKSVTTVRCTKHFLNAAAEASTQIGLAFEGAPPRQSFQNAPGIREFVEPDSRNKRRRLANALWQSRTA
jgi:enoyl-CoA hydratase/carnithine racemase